MMIFLPLGGLAAGRDIYYTLDRNSTHMEYVLQVSSHKSVKSLENKIFK